MPIREAFKIGEEVWVVLPSDGEVARGEVLYDFNGSANLTVKVTLKNGYSTDLTLLSRLVFRNRTCAYDDFITLLEDKRRLKIKELDDLTREIQNFKDERDNE